MPLYEYRCAGCGRKFEQLRRMQDADSALECPECRSSEVSRQLSTFAPHVASSAPQMAPCGAPGGACSGGRCQWQQ